MFTDRCCSCGLNYSSLGLLFVGVVLRSCCGIVFRRELLRVSGGCFVELLYVGWDVVHGVGAWCGVVRGSTLVASCGYFPGGMRVCTLLMGLLLLLLECRCRLLTVVTRGSRLLFPCSLCCSCTSVCSSDNYKENYCMRCWEINFLVIFFLLDL